MTALRSDVDRESEWEIKCEYTDTLWRTLEELVLVRQGAAKDSVDEYLDTKDGALYCRGYFLRIRDSRSLQFKYTPDADDASHIHSVEHRMPWPAEQVSLSGLPEAARSSLGVTEGRLCWDGEPLVQLIRIEKKRQEWSAGPLVIMIDDVVDLGRFVELEASSLDGANILAGLAERFHLEHVPVGYVELMLRRSRPSLYRLGRYVLPKDVAR
mgnify:CR=1 FL=1